jgi:hypothetical protein
MRGAASMAIARSCLNSVETKMNSAMIPPIHKAQHKVLTNANMYRIGGEV